MRRIQRLAARAEKRGLVKTLGSLLFRARFSVSALLPPQQEFRIAWEHTGKGYLRQGFERLWLLLAFRFEPEAYYWFSLFEPERFARAGEYMTHRQTTNIFDAMFEGLDPDRIQNKMLYAEICEQMGIPSPETLGLWTPADEPEPPFVDRLHQVATEGGVILKPRDAFGGRGISILHLDAAGAWSIRTKDYRDGDLTLSEVQRQLARSADCLIVQQLLRPHADLERFERGALLSVRTITLRDGDEFHFLTTHIRVGGEGAVADNFSSGGAAFPIDPATGRLGPGTRSAIADLPQSVLRVGDDGLEPPGSHVPMWDQVPDMAIRVHRAFPEFHSLGHDIAVTPDGPVVLESNTIWAKRTAQKVDDRGLGATVLAEILLAEQARREAG